MRVAVASLAGSVLLMLAPAGVLAGGLLRWRHDPGPPYSLEQVGQRIDAVEKEILDAGTIVIKQPDVWGQDRMTTFRREFEDQMRAELNQFQPILSARIARSDFAAFQGQSALAASATPRARPGLLGNNNAAAATTSTTSATANGPTVINNMPTAGDIAAERDGQLAAGDSLLAPGGANPATSQASPPGQGMQVPGNLGVEPTIYLDEKKRYIDHLGALRRINLGDDTSDSAGYGLYLLRMPVSIDPGRVTQAGWGALLSATVRHEFGPDFLPSTYRNLVINDLVDLLSPIVYELIRVGGWQEALYEFEVATHQRAGVEGWKGDVPCPVQDRLLRAVRRLKLTNFPQTRIGKMSYPTAQSDLANVFLVENLCRIARDTEARLRTRSPRGCDIRSYLRHELEAAYDIMRGQPDRPGLLADPGCVEEVVQAIHLRKFEGHGPQLPAFLDPPGGPISERNELAPLYRRLTSGLPGNLSQRSLGALCWAIAVDAGLLNRQLRDDMRRLAGAHDFACPAVPEAFFFYLPVPTPEADAAFREYVKARWPLIAFALDPVTDQQNIADAFHLGRDLQLAFAFAFVAGRVGLHQLDRYVRHVEQDSETTALNRTVTSFAFGNDTFGWRFSPRYQNPTQDHSNLHVLKDLFHDGGREHAMKSSRLEPGQRELTVAVIMPSFLQRIRIETRGHWFRLGDPAQLFPPTGRMFEESRMVLDLRQRLSAICDAGAYRASDLTQVATRVDQLEAMLPIQSRLVNVPYENTLGGFELFAQGATALVPELVGYAGADAIEPDCETDLLVVAKHIRINESKLIAGGVLIPPERYDLVSREVLQLRLPPGLHPTLVKTGDRGEQPFVEIYLATPNGISNQLMVPCRVAAAAAPPPALEEYVLLDDALNVTIEVGPKLDGGPRFARGIVKADAKLKVLPRGTTGAVAATILPTFGLPAIGGRLLPSYDFLGPVPFDGASGGYVVGGAQLAGLADHIARSLASAALLDQAEMAPELVAKSISVFPIIHGPRPLDRAVVNPIRVKLEFKLLDGAEVPASPVGRTPIPPGPSPGPSPFAPTAAPAPGPAPRPSVPPATGARPMP